MVVLPNDPVHVGRSDARLRTPHVSGCNAPGHSAMTPGTVHSAPAARTVPTMTRTSWRGAGARWFGASWRALVAVILIAVAAVAVDPEGARTVGACDELAVPSLGLTRCVVDGEQPEIDAGHVVRVSYLSSSSVHWLAGHRTSHGATFSSLTSLRIGASVRYRDQTYIVTDYRLVDRYDPETVGSWMSSDQPSVVLQTSASGPYVHVWRALALVPVVPVVAVAPPPVPAMVGR